MKQKKIILLTDEDKRKIALNRTPEERFDLLLRLIRMGKMLSNAKITHTEK